MPPNTSGNGQKQTVSGDSVKREAEHNHIDICIPKFTEVLCTIAKKWKQPKCPRTDEWAKKVQYIYIYMQWNNFSFRRSLAFCYINAVEGCHVKKLRQEKDKYWMISHICDTQRNNGE